MNTADPTQVKQLGRLTANASAHSSNRTIIWLRSCSLTAPGGQYNSVSHPLVVSAFSGCKRSIARLITAHHIGTVFESASGMRLPARVESTRTRLARGVAHRISLTRGAV